MDLEHPLRVVNVTIPALYAREVHSTTMGPVARRYSSVLKP